MRHPEGLPDALALELLIRLASGKGERVSEQPNAEIGILELRAGITREQAYTLCSLAADLRVTQVVNGNKGIHVMLDKKYLARA